MASTPTATTTTTDRLPRDALTIQRELVCCDEVINDARELVIYCLSIEAFKEEGRIYKKWHELMEEMEEAEKK
ncbi:hypothetical protein PtrSN001C_009876 [Pyrenophora tritici-repentis]|nr:hypothetical protein PtrSN001C_009876 [Pyrenophora tritici-repentis]